MANGQSPRAIVPVLLSDDDIERRQKLAGLQDADLARIAAVRDLVVRSVDQFCAIFFDALLVVGRRVGSSTCRACFTRQSGSSAST